MYKDGKWARQLLALQKDDGSWGWFHSLSQLSDTPVTTEQALRRLEGLGYTVEDECIRRAVEYMSDCLIGRRSIPDRAEKVSDWQVFSSLMLSTWIRRFVPEHPEAAKVAQQWSAVITRTFEDGTYDYQRYLQAYKEILKPQYGRINNFVTFYPVSLLCGFLDKKTEKAFCAHVIDHPHGIYYIYEKRLRDLPMRFESRETSRYLAAVELLARYPAARSLLGFVVDWLRQNRNDEGGWDLGKDANDKVYFPLSDHWRKPEIRISDCTVRTERLIAMLEQPGNL